MLHEICSQTKLKQTTDKNYSYCICYYCKMTCTIQELYSSIQVVITYKKYVEYRHGYLGSTLLACGAVARPHIKLEISFSVE